MNEKRVFARVMEYVDRTNSCPEAKDLVQKTLELFEKPEMQQLFSEFFKYCIFYRNMRNKLQLIMGTESENVNGRTSIRPI